MPSLPSAPVIRRKVLHWAIRYAPAEICGTCAAFVSFFAVTHTGGPLGLAAAIGSVCETLGYYTVIVYKELPLHWRAYHTHQPMRRTGISSLKCLRNMVAEFGTAELVDGLAVRPGLFYLLPLWFGGHMALALLSAKIISDFVFYGLAITGYELRNRILDAPPA